MIEKANLRYLTGIYPLHYDAIRVTRSDLDPHLLLRQDHPPTFPSSVNVHRSAYTHLPVVMV